MCPGNTPVQNAIPVSAGRRLDFVRELTQQRALPDISAWVVHQGTGEVGAGCNGPLTVQGSSRTNKRASSF